MTGDQTPPEWEPQEPAPEGSPARPLTVIAVLIAVLVIAGAGTAAAVILTGDGDEDGADGPTTPTPAAVSLDQWCHGMTEFTRTDDEEFDRDPSLVATALRGVGVPTGLPAEAQQGLEAIVSIAEQADDGEHAEQLYGDLSDAEQDNVEALFAFYTENCADELATDEPTTLEPKATRTQHSETASPSPSLLEEDEDQFPTELQTGLPKDWETYLPSDIPSEAESYLDNLDSSPER